ncbi:MAG: hypothetical protein VB062_07605 [Christensenella sp.]|nr:hypothetical protein [Christensenella sp.]
MGFQINLDSLLHGWATLSFFGPYGDCSVACSYVPADSLEDLIQGAIRLLDHRNSEIMFYLEPDMLALILKSTGDSEFSAEIANVRFYGTKTRLARQVLKIFDDYVFRYGYESYETNWGHPFPHRSLTILRECLHQKTN